MCNRYRHIITLILGILLWTAQGNPAHAQDQAIVEGTSVVDSETAAATIEGGGDDERGPFESEDGTVEMPMLVAPVTVGGRLHYYAYLRVKIVASGFEDGLVVREKAAFLQDGFVREVHRASIALNGDPKTIDGVGLRRRLMVVCDSVLGSGVVTDIVFGDTATPAEAATLEAEAAEPPATN